MCAAFVGPLAPGESSVTDDSGNTTYFDPNGNAIITTNPTPNWDTTPTTAETPVDSSGGTDLSSIGSFFGTMAGGIASLVRAATGQSAPVCPGTLPCAAPNKPGYLYNPQTGQYTPQTAGFSLSSLTAGSGLLILVAVALGIVFLARK
jgi:hypothetical protein